VTRNPQRQLLLHVDLDFGCELKNLMVNPSGIAANLEGDQSWDLSIFLLSGFWFIGTKSANAACSLQLFCEEALKQQATNSCPRSRVQQAIK
jgi:hypothetical protein